MEIRTDQLLAEAGQMALELRLKDRLIPALQGELTAAEAERAVMKAEIEELVAEVKSADNERQAAS